jgi:hypothetical protein
LEECTEPFLPELPQHGTAETTAVPGLTPAASASIAICPAAPALLGFLFTDHWIRKPDRDPNKKAAK